MTKAGTLRLLGALMLLSGCGSGTDTVAMPPGGGSEDAAEDAAADTAERAEDTGGDSPFDLSVLGPAWDNPATAWEPSEATPSDCPEFDQLTSDFRSWARTQRQHRVDGLLILEFTARAPSAADAAGYLERESTFMGDCATVVYDSGNLFQIAPASSRANQTTYTLRHDGYDEQRKMITVKDEWIISVTVLDSESAPPALVADVTRTLAEQSLR